VRLRVAYCQHVASLFPKAAQLHAHALTRGAAERESERARAMLNTQLRWLAADAGGRPFAYWLSRALVDPRVEHSVAASGASAMLWRLLGCVTDPVLVSLGSLGGLGGLDAHEAEVRHLSFIF
jgi:hypothetical protein